MRVVRTVRSRWILAIGSETLRPDSLFRANFIMSSAATAASLARPPRGVQVECNAPVTTFSVERAPAAESGATANVSDVALAAQMAVAERAKQDRTKLAKFRMDTLIRLREKAQAKRDAAAEKEAAEALRTAEATEYEIIQRADPTPPPSATSEEPPSTAPLPPSQLALMRYGLSEQAFASRDLLLSRCELPMPPQPADSDEEADALLGGDREEFEQLQQASCIKQYTVAL